MLWLLFLTVQCLDFYVVDEQMCNYVNMTDYARKNIIDYVYFEELLKSYKLKDLYIVDHGDDVYMVVEVVNLKKNEPSFNICKFVLVLIFFFWLLS